MPGLAAVAALLWSATAAPAQRIPRTPPPRIFVVNGTIKATTATTVTVAPNNGGAAVTVTVAPTTVISLDQAPATLAALLPGMRAEAAYHSAAGVNTAVRIEASDIFHVSGTITAVKPATATAPATVTITQANGTSVTVAVAATTVIMLDHAAATFASLVVGQRAEAVYKLTATGNVAVRIDADDIFHVSGTITAIKPATSTTPATVTITPVGGTAVTLTVAATTVITLDHAAATFASLVVGQRAEAVYKLTAAGNVAVRIDADDIFHVSGTITAIKPATATAPATVTITPAGGKPVILTVTASTAISVDGVAGKAVSDLLVGMQAQSTYQLTATANNALQIAAHDIFHVSGTITAIKPATATTPATVTITPAGGKPVILTVTASTAISVDGVAGKAVSDLLVGMQAQAKYQLTATANNALSIDASDMLRVTGTITKIVPATSTAPATVTITPTGGTAVTLTVAASTATSVDGVGGKAVSDLLVGMQAQAKYQVTATANNALSIDANDKVRVTGTITKIVPATATAPATVAITPTGGTAVTLTVTATTRISVNGVGGKAVTDLTVGMPAEAVYQVTATANNALRIEAGTDNDRG
jgi:hypothetical protein